MPLSLPAVKFDVIRLFGFTVDPQQAFIDDAAATCINAAFQDMFRESRGWFRNKLTSAVSVGSSGQTALNLDPDEQILAIWNPQGRPLNPLDRLVDALRFDAAFSGVKNPMGFYLNRSQSVSVSGSNVTITNTGVLYIAPAPTGATVFTVERTSVAPIVTLSNINDSTVVLPVPEDSVETYLLPLARGWAKRSVFFCDRIFKNRQQDFDNDYQKAIQALRLLGPRKDMVDPTTKPGTTLNR
jgi:hypothetical protein